MLREAFWYIATRIHYYFDGTYTQKVLLSTWDFFTQLLIYFVIGILVASLISVFWKKEQVAAFFHGRSGSTIIAAAIIGIVSPMPTYIAIPLVATLFSIGVPAPPLFAFLVASPLMNPILFFMTAGAFGYEMAVILLLSAFVLGTTAGFLLKAGLSREWFRKFLFARNSAPAQNYQGREKSRTYGELLQDFGHQTYRMTRFAFKYFALGIIIAALVKELVPASAISAMLGDNREYSVLVAVAAGVPLYACGGGAIPVMKTLQDLGLDKGAVLAFFISGPATKLSTLVALRAAFSGAAFIVYLAVALLGASLFGIIYNLW
jgi:uncharacterized membrane protein YraQ (UPF0718 family)